MPELMTIGYEGSTIFDFIVTLKQADVRTLIDVRELPLSRKKGFSKTALKEALSEANIDYIHLRDLGDPKPGRDAAKSGDFETFRRIYNAHIQSEKGLAAIEAAIPLASSGGACLMCFERCHTHCHRSIVVRELVLRADFTVRHLGVNPNIAGSIAAQ